MHVLEHPHVFQSACPRILCILWGPTTPEALCFAAPSAWRTILETSKAGLRFLTGSCLVQLSLLPAWVSGGKLFPQRQEACICRLGPQCCLSGPCTSGGERPGIPGRFPPTPAWAARKQQGPEFHPNSSRRDPDGRWWARELDWLPGSDTSLLGCPQDEGGRQGLRRRGREANPKAPTLKIPVDS